LKLDPRGTAYWTTTAKQGLHLGYRRLADRNGTWICRSYQGKSGLYAHRAFAQADDYSDADGDEVLSYYQAAQRLAGEAPPVRHSSGYTVADAVKDYLEYIEQQRKSVADAKSRLTSYVLPYFGTRPIAQLTPGDFDKWLTWALAHDPRAGASERVKRADVPEPERQRRRKATVNKLMGYTLAALNRAYEHGHVQSRDAWARVRKFKNATSARIARLDADEAKRLCNACAPDFRRLVQVALLTGCRYGELTRFMTRDFDAGSRTLLVAESKSGKPRRVPLTDEGCELLRTLTVGKAPEALILTKADGTRWRSNDADEPLRTALAAARIATKITFHGLRHTTASLLVEAGTPLAFVAEILGHADTRMVSEHYAHLAPSVVHDSVRANMPSFGVKVRRLRAA
jgi:integrase